MITYNHESFIDQAIEGVLMQKTNFAFELVIGEDNSNDRTREICIEYQKKHSDIIRLILNSNNLGMNPNFLKTLKACCGNYIALCEGDDYWTDPYKLQKQVDFLEMNPEFSLCFHEVDILKENVIVKDYLTKKVPEETNITELAKGNFIHTPSVVFRNNLFQDFPDQFSIAPVGDYFLHMLNARHGKIKRISQPMAVYRIHSEGVHSKKEQSQKNIEWLTQLSLMIPCFEEEVKDVLISNYLQLAKSVLLNSIVMSLEQQTQILVKMAELNPGYLIQMIEENQILNKQKHSQKKGLRKILKPLGKYLSK